MTSRFGLAPPPPPSESAPFPALYLLPLDESFYPPKRIPLQPGPEFTVRIGRQLNQKTTPGESNGVFESRVLSRQHAEVWLEGERFLIRDVKSSNGTFLNGERLSAEGVESEPFEIRSDDLVEFGIDIVGEQGEVVHRKVAARATCALTQLDAQRAVRTEQRVYPPAPAAPPPSPPNENSIPGGNAALPPFASPPALRRPQHATGLAGMGGMGSERIRPKSGDFDSILARLRDGPRSPPIPAPLQSSIHVGNSPPIPPSVPSSVAVPAASPNKTVINDAVTEDATALEQLRADLAQTQTMLASATASSSLVFPAPVLELDAPPNPATHPPLIVNARVLRSELAALREEAGALQRERTNAGSRSRRRRRRTAHLQPDPENVDEGEETEVEGSRAGEMDEDWEDDIDFHAGAAGVPIPLSSPSQRRRSVEGASSTKASRMLLGRDRERDPVPPDSPLTHEHDTRMTEDILARARAREKEDAELEVARTLSAQLDILAEQLETLQNQLRVLQSEPLVPAIAGIEPAEVDGLAELGRRVEELEGELSTATERASAPTPQSPKPDSDALCDESGTGAELDAIKEALRSGIASLQDEWAAFRTETAGAYSYPSPPVDSLWLGDGGFRLGDSSYEAGGPVTLAGDLVNRRAAHAHELADASTLPSAAAGYSSDDSDMLLAGVGAVKVGADTGAGVGGGMQTPAPAPHARQSSEEEEARVPGRWGLLTPAGSVRESSRTNGTAGVFGADRKSQFFALTKKGARTSMETEQTLLLAGAVGVGAMIVAAAWWGA